MEELKIFFLLNLKGVNIYKLDFVLEKAVSAEQVSPPYSERGSKCSSYLMADPLVMIHNRQPVVR